MPCLAESYANASAMLPRLIPFLSLIKARWQNMIHPLLTGSKTILIERILAHTPLNSVVMMVV